MSEASNQSDHEDDLKTQLNNLDFNNPLFLHPSDTSNIAIINIKLKGTENYNIWENSMVLALKVKNKVGFITGSCIRSPYDDALQNQWDRCNSLVLYWILNSINEELFASQIFTSDAFTVWNELKETYSKIDGSVIYNLHKQINSLTQNGSSVSDYYHSLNSLWRRYNSLTKLPTCVCDVSIEISDFNNRTKLIQFLMGLDDIYQPIRTTILTKDPLPSIKAAFAVISSEESHKGYPPNYKKKTNLLRNQSVSNVSSDQEYPKDITKSVSQPFTPEQVARIMALISDKNSAGASSTNMSVIYLTNSWIIDSGANQHMVTSEVYMFNCLDVSDLNLSVGHPNGTQAKIKKIGNLKVNKDIVLKDVLIPDYSDLLHQKLVMTGKEVGGLYVLNSVNGGEPINVSNSVISSLNSAELWHSRLGHPSDQVLQVLKSDLELKKGYIPIVMWSECILTAAYLINRTHSYVLSGKCP
ncbi:uncharacterized protein LOC143601249 [Bidens hawaiensis]|uniref:uncharacterized protein LOC143601249 n=1 Tax=Bidens hawaiensis TaxID=980011 RepID=UPI00404B1B5B